MAAGRNRVRGRATPFDDALGERMAAILERHDRTVTATTAGES